MKARLSQIGCWALVVAMFAGAGAFGYVFAETFNFTGEPNPGRNVLVLYAVVLTGTLLTFAYQRARRTLEPRTSNRNSRTGERQRS